ncbi:DUF6037 family protein [Lactococcus carnosus]|uniref:Uncharacterized protein n=1 Tax=Pseudolactococcus carnosus TaxID=2749961 RepID=A0ABT0AQX0_9LACT|nr:DUF6037 family protein [Lactococcus carnosus]MCJ1989095.1 hypothetical protein [Lactococcus carnosus]
MGFILKHLRLLHQEMKLVPVTASTFDFEYNKISCSCIFEANYLNGFSITFLKKLSGEDLELPVRKGYIMDSYIENQELYFKFWRYFNLKASSGDFSMTSFYQSLNQYIPKTFNIRQNYNRALLVKQYNVEKKDRPYFLGFKNWKVIKAKNPETKGTRSEENLDKTKLLYPLIYEATKNHDISVRYTDRNIQKDVDFKALLDESFNNDGII